MEIPEKSAIIKEFKKLSENTAPAGNEEFMAKKYYAVRAGRQTGVFPTWEQCRPRWRGFPGPSIRASPPGRRQRLFLTAGMALAAPKKNRRSGPDRELLPGREPFSGREGGLRGCLCRRQLSCRYRGIRLRGRGFLAGEGLHFFQKIQRPGAVPHAQCSRGNQGLRGGDALVFGASGAVFGDSPRL